jgi:hypothetical protein
MTGDVVEAAAAVVAVVDKAVTVGGTGSDAGAAACEHPATNPRTATSHDTPLPALLGIAMSATLGR